MEITKKEIHNHIRAATEGKQSGFSFLLDYFWNTVYGFQLKRVRNEHEAEDITIEAFAKAFDKIGTYNPNYHFSTWVITIAKNIQIDKSRKKNSNIYLKTTDASKKYIQQIPDHSPTAEDELIREQNLAELLHHIKQLNPDYQEVIQLRYFQEMRYNEIAEVLNEPLNTIKVRLLRARKLLSEMISNTK